MKISSILTTKGDFVATVAPDSSVTDLLALLAEHRIGAVVVSDDGRQVTGIVSERDIARAVHTHGAGALEHPVRDIMTAAVVTCDPDATTADLMGMMTERRVRHIPVLVDGELARLARRTGELTAGALLIQHPRGVDPVPWAARLHLDGPRSGTRFVVIDAPRHARFGEALAHDTDLARGGITEEVKAKFV